MSNLLQLQYFVNERLSAAALEILGAVEKTINEYREEICYAKEENVRLQQLLLDMEIKYRSDGQQLTPPEHPQIKEKPELQTSPWEEQRQGQESDVKSVIFTSPRVEHACVEEDSSYLSHPYHTVESREEDSQPEQIKTESDGQAYGVSESGSDCQSPSVEGQVYGVSEPASDCQPTAVVIPNYTTAQSSEEEESGGLLPEINPIRSKQTQSKPKQIDIGHIDSRETSEMKLTIEVLPETKNQFQRPSTSFHSPQSHAKNHTGALPYHGQECGKGFEDNSNLTVRMRTHTGETPRQFQGYGTGFKQSHNLAVHMRHQPGVKPYQCQVCGKGFGQKRYMLAHMKTHAKMKPYHCQECGKGFITVHDVRVHMRIHTGEKPYTCRECSKCFSTIGNLHVHMRYHSGEKPYWCQECGKSFRQKSHLDSHMRTHTGKNACVILTRTT